MAGKSSLSVLQLGIGLWTNSLWIVLMLMPVWLIMTTQVIAREEAYLERAFGEDSLRYKASVRRWIQNGPRTLVVKNVTLDQKASLSPELARRDR